MFNIVKISFFLIGVLVTLLFLFKFVICIKLWISRNNDPDKYWSIQRQTMFSDTYDWYIIPTAQIHLTDWQNSKCLEISCYFLKWEYYTNYQFTKEV